MFSVLFQVPFCAYLFHIFSLSTYLVYSKYLKISNFRRLFGLCILRKVYGKTGYVTKIFVVPRNTVSPLSLQILHSETQPNFDLWLVESVAAKPTDREGPPYPLCCTVLREGLEHLWIWVSAGAPGTNTPGDTEGQLRGCFLIV